MWRKRTVYYTTGRLLDWSENNMGKKIVSHDELIVYQKAFDAAMHIFVHSKAFPKEETYSLTDQVRRSSRSVCANIAEAWRKRRYEKAFISKLSDAESEAAETQVWLEFAMACGYMELEVARPLQAVYVEILKLLFSMSNHSDQWTTSEDNRTMREEVAEYPLF
jgi:four helix bundle protein